MSPPALVAVAWLGPRSTLRRRSPPPLSSLVRLLSASGWWDGAPRSTLCRRSPPPLTSLVRLLAASGWWGGAPPLRCAVARPAPPRRCCGALLPSLGGAAPPLDAAPSLASPIHVCSAAPWCRFLVPLAALGAVPPRTLAPRFASFVRLLAAAVCWSLPRWARSRRWPPRPRLLCGSFLSLPVGAFRAERGPVARPRLRVFGATPCCCSLVALAALGAVPSLAPPSASLERNLAAAAGWRVPRLARCRRWPLSLCRLCSPCLHPAYSLPFAGTEMVSSAVRVIAAEVMDELRRFVGPVRLGPVTLELVVQILGLVEVFTKNHTNLNFHLHVSGYDTLG